jgi:hypothetical protein
VNPIINVDLIPSKHVEDSPAHQSHCRSCNRTFGNRESLNQHLATSSRHRSVVLYQGSAGRKVSPTCLALQFFLLIDGYHYSDRPPLSTTSIVLSVANLLLLHLRSPSTSSLVFAVQSHAIRLQLLSIRWELFLPYPSPAVCNTKPAHRSLLFAP